MDSHRELETKTLDIHGEQGGSVRAYEWRVLRHGRRREPRSRSSFPPSKERPYSQDKMFVARLLEVTLDERQEFWCRVTVTYDVTSPGKEGAAFFRELESGFDAFPRTLAHGDPRRGLV